MTAARLTLLLSLLVPVWASAVESAAPGLRFLLRDARLCDVEETVCLQASVTWEPNDRLIAFYGRVRASTHPGVLVVVFRGHARDGTVRHAEMRLPLDGHYSEIARDKMIPDWPDVNDWVVDYARYEPPGRPPNER